MKFVCIRELGTLRPVDDRGRELLSKLKLGFHYQVEVRQPRNIKELKLYFAMVHLIFPQQSQFLTEDDLDEELRIAVGHCTRRMRPNGEIAVKAKSLKFTKLDQHNWRSFLDAVIQLIITEIIPGLDEGDLRRELEQITGLKQ